LGILHRGEIVAARAFGRHTFDSSSPAVTVETIFDLASLTKVIATTSLAMVLHQRGRLDLDSSIAGVLPELAQSDPQKRSVTVRMLLNHTSGLPAHAKLYHHAAGCDAIMQAACRLPLQSSPGSRAIYSDIGFILLGELLARLGGAPFVELCQREVFAPLALQHTAFNPPKSRMPCIPPTLEFCPFRKRAIQGEVNDENASAMGGIAGHAGLFAPLADVLRFANSLLSGGSIFTRKTIALFTQRQPNAVGSFALGWDTPSLPSQSGRYFSAQTFGHLGYTGTSLWIDPTRELAVVFLTNRTWPSPDRPEANQIKQIRPAVHDAISEALPA